MNLEFDNLRWLLYLVAGVILVAGIGVYGVWQRRRSLRRFATPNLLDRLAPRRSWTAPLVRLSLVVLALTGIGAALLGPRWGERQQQVFRRGIDVMVVLDVSRSMLARDIAPNRLERAKTSVRDDLLPMLGGDRIGLIAFAGLALVKSPLTSDYGFFRLALDDISTESVPKGGTLIGDALRKAGESFDNALDSHKVVLLITDGEDQESYPVEAARKLWEERKIPVIAVALGDERDGARIPSAQRGEEYVKYKGETVWSRANFDDLRKIADMSDLKAFVPVGTKNFDLGDIYRQRIAPGMHARDTTENERQPLPAQYQWFAAAGLACLLFESFLREGRGAAAVLGIARQKPEREAA